MTIIKNKTIKIDNLQIIKIKRTGLSPENLRASAKYLLRNKNINYNNTSFYFTYSINTNKDNIFKFLSSKDVITITDNVIINLKNKFEKNYYAEFLLRKILEFNLNSNKKEGFLILKCSESNKYHYNKFVDNFMLNSEEVKLSNLTELLYKSWTACFTDFRTPFNLDKIRRFYYKNIKIFKPIYNYICIQIKLQSKDNIIYILGDKFIIDLNNKKEIRNFLKYIIQATKSQSIPLDLDLIWSNVRKSNTAEHKAYNLYRKVLNIKLLPYNYSLINEVFSKTLIQNTDNLEQIKTQIIKTNIKTPINPAQFKIKIIKLLNEITISQYISVVTKINFKNSNILTKTLGNKYYLDLQNKEEKDLYINYIFDMYKEKFTNHPDFILNIRLFINCEVCNKVDYLKFKKELGNPLYK